MTMIFLTNLMKSRGRKYYKKNYCIEQNVHCIIPLLQIQKLCKSRKLFKKLFKIRCYTKAKVIALTAWYLLIAALLYTCNYRVGQRRIQKERVPYPTILLPWYLSGLMYLNVRLFFIPRGSCFVLSHRNVCQDKTHFELTVCT